MAEWLVLGSKADPDLSKYPSLSDDRDDALAGRYRMAQAHIAKLEAENAKVRQRINQRSQAAKPGGE